MHNAPAEITEAMPFWDDAVIKARGARPHTQFPPHSHPTPRSPPTTTIRPHLTTFQVGRVTTVLRTRRDSSFRQLAHARQLDGPATKQLVHGNRGMSSAPRAVPCPSSPLTRLNSVGVHARL